MNTTSTTAAGTPPATSPYSHPTQLPELPAGWPVAVDCETGHLNPGGSALWADSGARLSAISVAWVDPQVVTDPDPDRLWHAVQTGDGVHSVAYPFSQGDHIGPDLDQVKPGAQPDLFNYQDNPNLGPDAYLALFSWLTRNTPRLVFHNGKFDLEKLRHEPLGWDAGIGVDLLFDRTFWDTQVVCPIVWPREPVTSLKPTAARLWGESETAERDALAPYLGPKTDPQYDRVPWSVIGPYAAKDAAQTIRLFYQQRAELGVWRDRGALDPIRLLQAYREIEVMRVLYRMERAGVPFDAGSSRRIAAELATRRAHLDAGLPFKPTPAAAGRWFFTDQVLPRPGGGTTTGVGLLPYQMTATGRPSMTAEITNRLVQDLDPDTEPGRAAAALAERSKLDTAIKMWYGPYADGVGSDGRLRTCFRQVARGRGDQEGGTRSGRFSVERVNLQAIPHDYRLVAGTDRTWPVATPRQLIGQAAAGLAGWQLWEFDLQQAELRVAAAYARCEPMLEAMRHGRDLHGETTSKLFQLGPDDPRWSFYRQLGKRANFSLGFGAGGKTFGGMVAKETGHILSVDEAGRIVEDWNLLYPQFRRAIERWSRFVEEHRALPLASVAGFATGRLRVFRKAEDEHKAFNQLVQASLAEFMRDWLIGAQRVCDEAGLGLVPGVGWTGLLLTIHDSLVLLLPDDRADELAARVVGVAVDLWGRYFGRGDPLWRVAGVDGGVDAKRWG